MSQCRITSFFAVKNTKKVEESPDQDKRDDGSVKDKFEDSPIKSSAKRKRSQKILSDSEEEANISTSPTKNCENGIKRDKIEEIKTNLRSDAKHSQKAPTKRDDETSSENDSPTSKKKAKKTPKKSLSKKKKVELPKKENLSEGVSMVKNELIETPEKMNEKLKKYKARKSVSSKVTTDDKNDVEVNGYQENKEPKADQLEANISKEEFEQNGKESKGSKKESELTHIKTSSPHEEKNNDKPFQSQRKGTSFFGFSKKEASLSSEKAGINSFDPSKSNYHPTDDACWSHGQAVPYFALSRTLEKIEGVSARLKMIDILSNYFRSVIVLTPDDLLPSVYLCLNSIAPAFEGVELGVAETNLMKAIAQSTGRSVSQIKSDAASLGDLGLVAEQSKCSQRTMFTPPPLTIRTVFNKLKEIASMTGNASQGKKIDKIQAMFVACKGPEARYLIRSLAGKLRIGLAEQSVLQALAQACLMTPPAQQYPPEIINAMKGVPNDKFKTKLEEYSRVLKTTYCECPNYNLIIPVLLKEGLLALPEHCKLTPGVPTKPMLAHPTKGVQEVLRRFEGLKFTCEWKYDGERAQIHMDEEGKISIYSRNQENNTSKYPDIVARVSSALRNTVKSFILDAEAVAWDLETQKIRPFQILTTRKRKDANESEIKVQVCVFMFDLIYLNGEPLVTKTFAERRELLRNHFQEVEGQWKFATSLDTQSMEEVQEFLEESVKGNCEGLMVKTLEEEASYEIAKRSRSWLKLKKDYVEGVGDSLDVVVLGAYLGRGKRTGLYGGFLLGCYDPENEEFQSLCKIGTGFSDEDLQKHSDFFKEHVIDSPRPYYRYDSSLEPDHWFDAVQVWEVKCADLSLSPVHRAAIGIVDPEKGISLRFPRFLKVRVDKTVEDATSAQQIADMYQNQDIIKNQQAESQKKLEEDFY